MAFYWSPTVVGNFFQCLLSVLLFIIFERKVRKQNHSKLVPKSFIAYWFGALCNIFFGGLAHLLNEPFFLRIAFLFDFMFVLSILIWFQMLFDDKPNIWILIPLIIVFGIKIGYVFLSDSIYIDFIAGFPALGYTSIAAEFAPVETWVSESLVIFYSLKYVIEAPRYLKWRVFLLIIVNLVGIIATQMSGQILLNFGVSMGLDALYLSIILLNLPQILYLMYTFNLLLKFPEFMWVLALRVKRLIVIDNESGIPLFTYQWAKDGVEETLFAGLLQGIQMMSFEVLKMGKLDTIHVEEGLLSLHRGNYVTVGVTSERSTKSLHEFTQEFCKRFETDFSQALATNKNNIEAFEPAKSIVQNVFFGIVPRIQQR